MLVHTEHTVQTNRNGHILSIYSHPNAAVMCSTFNWRMSHTEAIRWFLITSCLTAPDCKIITQNFYTVVYNSKWLVVLMQPDSLFRVGNWQFRTHWLDGWHSHSPNHETMKTSLSSLCYWNPLFHSSSPILSVPSADLQGTQRQHKLYIDLWLIGCRIMIS